MSWINKLKIEESIKEIQSDEKKGKDFCLDPLRFEDLSIKKVKQEIINEILNKLSKGAYNVGNLICIDIPKSNYILRPASRPVIIDWIIYNAIVNFIISKIYKEIPKNSYSFTKFKDKFRKKKKYKKQIDYWLEFENDSIKLSKNQNYEYLLVTDISSYFEHISLVVLKNRLNILHPNNKDYNSSVNFLIENILEKWTVNNQIPNFGLPQGPTTSTMLADIYLYPVDKEMRDNEIKYLRYMDDIRLFAKNLSELKRNIKTLVIALRKLKLNLNPKKTNIYNLDDPKELEKVFDPNRDKLNFIDKIFRRKSRESLIDIIPYLFSLKDEYYKNTTFSERYLKFFIFRIVDLMKFKIINESDIEKLIKEFQKLFKEKHHLANLFSWFFVASGKYSKKIANLIKSNLIKFVCNKKINIYEWQEMWALDAIRQLGRIKIADLRRVKKKYSKQNDLCYSQFSLIAGQYGNLDEKEEILHLGKYKNDLYRSSLLSVQDLNKSIVRNSTIYKIADKYFKEYFDRLITGKYYGFNYNLKILDFEDFEYFISDY